jgi:branched-chain amino acid transport system permease protein
MLGMVDLLPLAIVNGFLVGGVYGLTAVGLTLIFGVMGVANFAQGSFVMVGMYVAYWFFALLGVDPYLSIVPAFLFLYLIGWFVQKCLLNRIMDAPHYDQFLCTIGIMLILQNLAVFLWPDYRQINVTYQNMSLPIAPDIRIEVVRILAFVVAVGMAVGLYYFLKLTRLGKAIRATSQNKDGAIIVGVEIHRIYIVTFAIGSACAGVAGAVVSPLFPVSNDIGDLFIVTAFCIVVLGGMGNALGALVGGMIIGVAESVGALVIPGGQKQLITFAILIVVLLFRPQGLFRFGGYWQAQRL